MATVTFRPTSNGSLAGWTASTGSDYECVDESTSNGDTDYVYAAPMSHDFESFRHTVSGITSADTINSVTVYAVARGLLVGKFYAPALDLGFRFYETLPEGYSYRSGTLTNLTTSYTTISRTFTTNPDSGVAWHYNDFVGSYPVQMAFSGINAGPSLTDIRVTQIYMVIDYTPASSSEVKKVAGIVNANVKKISGVAAANIKKVAGVTY